MKSHILDDGTDVKSLIEGYITVTPLQFDLTAQSALAELQRETWELDLG